MPKRCSKIQPADFSDWTGARRSHPRVGVGKGMPGERVHVYIKSSSGLVSQSDQRPGVDTLWVSDKWTSTVWVWLSGAVGPLTENCEGLFGSFNEEFDIRMKWTCSTGHCSSIQVDITAVSNIPVLGEGKWFHVCYCQSWKLESLCRGFLPLLLHFSLWPDSHSAK